MGYHPHDWYRFYRQWYFWVSICIGFMIFVSIIACLRRLCKGHDTKIVPIRLPMHQTVIYTVGQDNQTVMIQAMPHYPIQYPWAPAYYYNQQQPIYYGYNTFPTHPAHLATQPSTSFQTEAFLTQYPSAPPLSNGNGSPQRYPSELLTSSGKNMPITTAYPLDPAYPPASIMTPVEKIEALPTGILPWHVPNMAQYLPTLHPDYKQKCITPN